jgi:iron uptake system EfeUOB component EfeO/EfeM
MRVALTIALCSAAILVAACGSGNNSRPAASRAASAARRQPPNAAKVEPNSSDEVPLDEVPVVPAELTAPLASYTRYVEALLAQLRPQIATLKAVTERGDLSEAEHDWLLAHISWLELGQDDDAYSAFGQLGEQIDGEANGLPGTTSNPSFTGFHKIEMDLWKRHNLQAANRDTDKLQSLVVRLAPKLVNSDLPATSLAIDSWVLRAHEILEDALRDSLTQDDDYGSNTDLSTIAADVTATREMLTVLAPVIEPRAPKVVPAAVRALATLVSAINAAGGPLAEHNLADMPLRTRLALDQAVSAAVEALAPISELMQIQVPGS